MANNESADRVEGDGNQERIDIPESEDNPTGKNTQKKPDNSPSSEDNALGVIRTAEHRMIWLTGAMAFFAFCGVIVGILQWITSSGQKGTMDQTFEAMFTQTKLFQGQLEQMKVSSTLARQQLVGSQGAVLEAASGGGNAICAIDRPENIDELHCNFVNSGHVTATIKHFELSVSDGILPEGRALVGKPLISFSPDAFELAPQTAFTPTWPLRRPEPLGPSGSWPTGWPGKTTYVINGDFSYDNGFGGIVRRQFCNVWLPGYTIPARPPQRTFTQSTSGGFINCMELGSTITRAKDEEKKAE